MFYFTYCLHNSCRLLPRNHNSKKTQKSQQQQKEKKQEAEKIKSQNPEEPRSQTGKQHKKIKIEPIANQFHSYRNMIRTNKTSITSIAKNAFCIHIYIYNNANYIIYIHTIQDMW